LAWLTVVGTLFAEAKRFFLINPGDLPDEFNRLLELTLVDVRFGDNGWDISSLIVVDGTTVNDDDVGNVDDSVLLMIKRGVGFDIIECVDAFDDDNKISDIEFERSLKIKKRKWCLFVFLLLKTIRYTVCCWLASGRNWLNSARRSVWSLNNCATFE